MCARTIASGGASRTIGSPVSFAPHAKPAHAPAMALSDEDDDDNEDDARRVASRLSAASVARRSSPTASVAYSISAHSLYATGASSPSHGVVPTSTPAMTAERSI